MADPLDTINGLPGFTGVVFENSDSSNALDILTLDCGDLLFGTNILDPFVGIAGVTAATISPTAADTDNDNITNLITTTNNNIDSHLSGNIQPASSTSNLQSSPRPPSLDPFSALFPFPFPVRDSGNGNSACTPTRNNSNSNHHPFIPTSPYHHHIFDGLLPRAVPPAPFTERERTNWTSPLSDFPLAFSDSNSDLHSPSHPHPYPHPDPYPHSEQHELHISPHNNTTNTSTLNINIENNLAQEPRRHSPLPTFNNPEPADQGIDDPYVAALATGDFSSPSLPPLSSSPLPPPSRHRSSHLPKPLEIGETMPPALRRSSRGSRGGGGVVDLTKEEPDFDNMNSGIDPTTPMAPRARKRHRATITRSLEDAKRRRTSQSSSRPAKAGRNTLPRYDASSPFEEDFGSPQKTDNEDPDSIDLSNVDEVPTALMAPKVDNRVKLGKFQCVICMDDVTALTVTHCGHLFCSECLHSSLHIDSMKKTCPVCRTKVDLKDKKGKNTKSYYHLELKVMTATKKGKRPASRF
ncbi:hypothetical protein DL766_000266 [Monosporascus sp. MC13-8B]|uniref:RING-type domain-containing protein n=1 Tax=Monosporascus cannonballus TaxID=155416 RepID=A0ABY0H0R1_9PEZI|nr:hypothetical protein DL763_008627 [Monosporascus cannonballus]RYO81560.1 hypothetical protein DL762_007051 [Monosporascus cannonballus]RYP39824.1 hypothetical protein DL766_000266 [Monosporascus sp. MC13-8B]